MKQYQSGLIGVSIMVVSGVLLFMGHNGSKAEEVPAIKQINETQLKVPANAWKNLHFITAATRVYPDQIEVTGKVTVTENGATVIPARAAGRIEAVNITSGEPVEKGQIVAKIYSSDFAGAREEYLQSTKRKGDRDFNQLQSMSVKKLESLGLSKQDVAQLGKGDPNLLVVRSPATGVVIDKKAVLGSAVNAGDPLFTIGDLHKVWFLGDLYPEDLPKVREGQVVVIDPPLPAGDPIHGIVSFISPIIDPNTRTIKIRMLMDNPQLALRADMYVQAHIILSTHIVILVPATTIFNEDGKDYVFRQKKDADNVIEKIAVVTRREQGNDTVIASGVEPGDTLVSDGGLLLNSLLDTMRAP